MLHSLKFKKEKMLKTNKADNFKAIKRIADNMFNKTFNKRANKNI